MVGASDVDDIISESYGQLHGAGIVSDKVLEDLRPKEPSMSVRMSDDDVGSIMPLVKQGHIGNQINHLHVASQEPQGQWAKGCLPLLGLRLPQTAEGGFVAQQFLPGVQMM